MLKHLLKILNGEIKRILVAVTPYHFLILLAREGATDFRGALLITTSDIHANTLKHFPNALVAKKLPGPLWAKLVTYILYRLHTLPLQLLLKLRARSIEFIGVDHLFISNLLTVSQYTLIEDGSVNYLFKQKTLNPLFRYMIRNPYGTGIRCTRILLTGILEVPDVIANKVERLSLKDTSHCAAIRDFFDFEGWSDGEEKGVLILTQPLSEDALCSEREKLDLYRKVLEDEDLLGTDSLVIKPHPRETTDWSKAFPMAQVLDGSVPVEVTFMSGSSFRNAISLFSTTIYHVRAHKRIMTGTLGIPYLERRFGIIVRKEF